MNYNSNDNRLDLKYNCVLLLARISLLFISIYDGSHCDNSHFQGKYFITLPLKLPKQSALRSSNGQAG